MNLPLGALHVILFRESFIVAQAGSAVTALFIAATEAAGPVLIATFWQGLILAVMTAFCLRLVPGATATLRFTFWTTALLLLCVLPFAVSHPENALHTSVFHVDSRWSLVAASLWLTLSLIRAIDLAAHAIRLRSLSRQARPVPTSPGLADLLRTGRGAQLCTSTELDCPGVIGFLHPRILIPAWLFDQLTMPEIEQIVLHELEHLRRHDDWFNLLQKLALVAFPLNPALHWIERRLCLERELACDEGVVRRTRAPRLYAACLARLAERGLDHRALSLALGFLERQSELTRRVASILSAPRTLSARQSVALTGIVAALLLGGAAELARCPQLVSFAVAPRTVASSADPHLATGTWVAAMSTRSVLYNDAFAPHLVHTASKQVRSPLHKTKTHRTHPPLAALRASADQTESTKLLTADLVQPAPTAPTTPNLTPTLVRYTLVHVDGGWLLLQL